MISKRILGIDYGTKRIGIAVSDESRKFALPVSVIANGELAIKEIEKIATEYATKEFVMGESRNFKNEPNAVFDDSMDFKDMLEGGGFTVHLEPEFMTSANAERFQGKTDKTDASAAALILQSYLDKEK
jgi:putative Holliday junction resolvase